MNARNGPIRIVSMDGGTRFRAENFALSRLTLVLLQALKSSDLYSNNRVETRMRELKQRILDTRVLSSRINDKIRTLVRRASIVEHELKNVS